MPTDVLCAPFSVTVEKACGTAYILRPYAGVQHETTKTSRLFVLFNCIPVYSPPYYRTISSKMSEAFSTEQIISEAVLTKLERTGAHSHIRGLGLDAQFKPKDVGFAFLCFINLTC